MNQKKRRWMAAGMSAVMMMGILAGCSGDANGDSSGETSAAAVDSGNTSVSGDEAQESSGAVLGKVNLPIVDEPTTITAFFTFSGNASGVMESYSENTFFQELEKRTGIHIDFYEPGMTTAQNSYELMFSGGDITDLIMNAPVDYRGGDDMAVEDGAFMDLTELIPKYMPNYYAMITSREDIYRDVVTEEGRLVGIYQVYSDLQPQGAWFGTVVRKDWLDECGLDIPVTYDDWTEMLRAFKEKYGCTSAFTLTNKGYIPINGGVNTGFGVSESFIRDGNTVKYGPIEEGWREYAQLMNQWYEKDLLIKNLWQQLQNLRRIQQSWHREIQGPVLLYILWGLYMNNLRRDLNGSPFLLL